MLWALSNMWLREGEGGRGGRERKGKGEGGVAEHFIALCGSV